MKTKTVTIPACAEHNGFHQIDVTLNWTCPVCGGERGEVYKGRSYDGSRSMTVDCWNNPCGHVDKYWQVREEAIKAKRDADEEIIQSFLTADWEQSVKERAAWDRGESLIEADALDE